MNGIQYATSINPSTINISYSISGPITSFVASLYYSADDKLDGSDVSYTSWTILVSPGGNPHSAALAFGVPVPGDPNRPYLIVMADSNNAISETKENDNTSNALVRPIGTLTADKNLYDLMDTATISATVSIPSVSVVIQAGLSGKPWVDLANGMTASLVQRIAGRVYLRAKVFVGNVRFDSTVTFVTVRFPNFNTIRSQGPVINAADAAWQETQSFAFNNAGALDPATNNYPNMQVREEGFWVFLATSGNGSYSVGPMIYGPPTGVGVGIDPAKVDTGDRPADQFSPPSPGAPLGSAIYSVAALHTHPPFTYADVGLQRAAGPSGNDASYYSNRVGVPGLVYDYDASPVLARTPLNMPAHMWPSGPDRRSTP